MEVESEPTETPEATESAESAEPSPEPGSAEDALPYLEAVAVGPAAATGEGLVHAREGSPAHGYLQYRADNAQALQDVGEVVEPLEVDVRENDAQLCQPSGCVTFGAFMYEDGLLSDFEVNGNTVSDNFHPGGGEFEEQGATVTVGSSYYSNDSNHLAVILYVEADAETSFEVTIADYRDPAGNLVLESPGTSAGNKVVGAGSSGVLLYTYAGAETGGSLELTLECFQGCEGAISGELPLN
ncbi:hypothetical protein [Nocardiopsis ganjiahuensis]|uniref:hypothetical protein n=1 Tax=Nocardiopsis ganjiahuensis TaxID=239984 RepID=UPI000344C758|nr:hypothetical protein [Nocardiopsis ganjiahuensis]